MNDDTISRQAALEAIEELKNRYFDRKVVLAKAQDVVNNLPTIDPVKHGKWIGIDDYPHETWECDQCGCIYEEMPSWTPNYCPNCGAKMMEGEEDERTD